MNIKTLIQFVLGLLFVAGQMGNGLAQPAAQQKTTVEEYMARINLRSIGPALTSGRVNVIAVHPEDPTQYFIGAASGGVWRTRNAGTTWTPVFEKQGSYSIGAISIDPRNPNIVWVGTGEYNAQRSVGYGDGVYKSEDAGRTWKKMGLPKSEHIGRIAIDPRNSNTVFVAAQGPLWNAGGDRGLYRTNDGGKNWERVLHVSEDTGITDVVFDLKDPNTLYAASWQRRRHVFTYIGGGIESAIYRSTDGGTTWEKAMGGLSSGEYGRIGLTVSPANPNYIYATVDGTPQNAGIYRSTDKGVSWEKRGNRVAAGMYYGQIIADPKDPERIYIPDVIMQVSNDGGRTLQALGERNKHVDNHAFWVNPHNTRHYLIGCDGGVYESFDRGETWLYKSNLPLTQFYRVNTDNSLPFYYVYGGTQDNNSLGGPSRTRSSSGIPSEDWFITLGGDGFHQAIDPTDPNIVYSVLQYGVASRFNRKTKERVGISPIEGKGESALRWNWDSPLIISPHAPSRLYFAANRVFRSEDRGDSWQAISADLTQQIDRNLLKIMGKVWRIDAVSKAESTSLYGNIVSLEESPKKEGLLYVGTDDGLIQITEDGGKTWRKIEKFPGVPEKTYVSDITASPTDPNTVFATFNNHKQGDFAPYILKSTDVGRTWQSIVGDLPANNPVHVIKQDFQQPSLLFLGTEFGGFVSINGGANWKKFSSLPTIPVKDIALQQREMDAVFATFGRGFYVLDDYSPLRNAADAQQKEAYLFTPRQTTLFQQWNRLGFGSGSQGETFFFAPNPPTGVTFTYYLKEDRKTKKQVRLDAERNAERDNQVPPYPTAEQLRLEAEEDPPVLLLTIFDEAGEVVRRLSTPISAGVHRVTWDTRGATNAASLQAGSSGGGFPTMPGKYKAILSQRVDGVVKELAPAVAFTLVAETDIERTADEKKALLELRRKMAKLQSAAQGANDLLDTLLNRIALIKQAVQESPKADGKLREQVIGLERNLFEIRLAMRGNSFAGERTKPEPPSVMERIFQVSGTMQNSTRLPTQTLRASYQLASGAFAETLLKLRKSAREDFPRLERALDSAGVPYTPGRLPEWTGD